MSEWELEPILHDYWGKYPIPCSSSDDLQRWLSGYSADLIQKYQAHLTSQCGPEPCDQCRDPHKFDGGCYDEPNCAPKARHEGYQSGYAKAMQEMEASLESERAKGKAEGA